MRQEPRVWIGENGVMGHTQHVSGQERRFPSACNNMFVIC